MFKYNVSSLCVSAITFLQIFNLYASKIRFLYTIKITKIINQGTRIIRINNN